MIWGCQLDPLKSYMGEEANDVSGILQEGRKLTGQYNDEVQHIVDFRGNVNEWSMTGTWNDSRLTYGGHYATPSFTITEPQVPTQFRGYLGTRPQLYIK